MFTQIEVIYRSLVEFIHRYFSSVSNDYSQEAESGKLNGGAISDLSPATGNGNGSHHADPHAIEVPVTIDEPALEIPYPPAWNPFPQTSDTFTKPAEHPYPQPWAFTAPPETPAVNPNSRYTGGSSSSEESPAMTSIAHPPGEDDISDDELIALIANMKSRLEPPMVPSEEPQPTPDPQPPSQPQDSEQPSPETPAASPVELEEPFVTEALADLVEEVKPPMTGALSGLARELRFTVDDEDEDEPEAAESPQEPAPKPAEIKLARPRFGDLQKSAPPPPTPANEEEGLITDALADLMEEVKPPMAGALSGLARELRFTVDDEDEAIELDEVQYISDDELNDVVIVDDEDFISVDDEASSEDDQDDQEPEIKPAEALVPAESTALDAQAEKPAEIITAEEITPEPVESPAAAALETTVEEKWAEPPVVETANAEPLVETPTAPPAATPQPETPPASPSPFITTDQPADETGEPVEVVYQYRVSAVLSPDIEVMLNKVRHAANLSPAEPGFFTFQSGFQVEDIQKVIEAVRDWASDHLPLALELDRVDAMTIGARRYAAGWLLEPADAFETLKDTLRQSLAPHIDWRADTEFPPGARLLAGDFVPAKEFPLLIREMQREFDVLEWNLEGIEILRAPQFDNRWEVVEKIAAEDS